MSAQEQPDKENVDDDEDKKNPAYVPRKGAFYEHDLRTGEEDTAEETPKYVQCSSHVFSPCLHICTFSGEALQDWKGRFALSCMFVCCLASALQSDIQYMCV